MYQAYATLALFTCLFRILVQLIFLHFYTCPSFTTIKAFSSLEIIINLMLRLISEQLAHRLEGVRVRIRGLLVRVPERSYNRGIHNAYQAF